MEKRLKIKQIIIIIIIILFSFHFIEGRKSPLPLVKPNSEAKGSA